MWTHKPHTKRPDFRQLRQADITRSSNNMMHNAGHKNNPHNSQRSDNNDFPHYQNQDSNRNINQNLTLNLNLNLNHNLPRNQNLNLNFNLNKNLNLRQKLNQQQNNSASDSRRNVNNTPLWISKKDDGSKKKKLCVTSGSIFNTTATPLLRKISLSLNNKLLSAVIRFGTSEESEIAFSCHLDSCAAMNTENSLLHMWIMTIYPEIVASCERYDDDKLFQTITLDYVYPLSAADKDASKLFAVVSYKT